jgi:hypothetical protein
MMKVSSYYYGLVVRGKVRNVFSRNDETIDQRGNDDGGLANAI